MYGQRVFDCWDSETDRSFCGPTLQLMELGMAATRNRLLYLEIKVMNLTIPA